jgi:hypothetical protein
MSDTAEHKSERQTVLKHGNRKHVPNIKTNTKQSKLPDHTPGTGHSYTTIEESADTLQTMPKQNTSMASNEVSTQNRLRNSSPAICFWSTIGVDKDKKPSNPRHNILINSRELRHS